MNCRCCNNELILKFLDLGHAPSTNDYLDKDDLSKLNFNVVFVKNPSSGPCAAIKEGLFYGESECAIVYPADDFLNVKIIDKMYFAFKEKNDIVVASRFIKGGSMK